jgi:hypothetical protein
MNKPFVSLCVAATLFLGLTTSGHSGEKLYDRGDNALWMRRYWIHESPTSKEIKALVASLRERGIKRIYPFLGPMDKEGWPGWRSSTGIKRYIPERAAAFFTEFHRIAPEIKIIPWTGGILNRDVRLTNKAQRKAFADHARRLIALGADGIQLNIEPMPSHSPGYRELLQEVKAAIGKNHILSLAAYPPPTPLHPYPDVHWELPFMRNVCMDADELAVMAYDTAVKSPGTFEKLIATWTRQLAATLPSPSKGGCEWLMGVPAYDDDKGYHRPDVETVEYSLKGIRAGLGSIKVPESFRGVAIYASFTTDSNKWTVYNKLWRGVGPSKTPPPDLRNAVPE